MGMFKDMLKSNETIFKNPIALDYDFVPKLIPYREKEQFTMARCIKPLLAGQNGRNLIIHGRPGVGKTAACKHVLNDLEQETEEVVPIYVNCWQRNTTHKIILEVCDVIGIKFVQNKKTEELITEIERKLNKIAAVFVFDEIDKVEDYTFLYSILESIHRKTIFLITNFKEWIADLDERIKSRLTAEVIAFNPYNLNETKGILIERANVAFNPGVIDADAFELICAKSFELSDIRSGLYLLRESGNIAEDYSSRKITAQYAKEAISKLNEFTVKKKEDLDSELQTVMEVIKANSGKRIGDIFKAYQEKGGQSVYKTFQRKIANLEKNKFITVDKQIGGADGSTSMIFYGHDPDRDKYVVKKEPADKPKTLDEF